MTQLGECSLLDEEIKNVYRYYLLRIKELDEKIKTLQNEWVDTKIILDKFYEKHKKLLTIDTIECMRMEE